jgi:hypothetical protein
MPSYSPFRFSVTVFSPPRPGRPGSGNVPLSGFWQKIQFIRLSHRARHDDFSFIRPAPLWEAGRSKKILRQGESSVVLDRVLFFSYASIAFIIVPEKTDAWRIARIPDSDFEQAPARRTDRSGRQGCEVRQSMSTLKRSHRCKSGLEKREQGSRAPGNPIFKARTL